MDTKELLKKVRKIEIKTRRLSDHVFGGEYHSTFKGRGMTFSEVRQYQFGDDVRAIDWNVTARYNEPFVKVFEEERELTLPLIIYGGNHGVDNLEVTRPRVHHRAKPFVEFTLVRNDGRGGVCRLSCNLLNSFLLLLDLRLHVQLR